MATLDFFFLKGKMIVHEIKNKHLRDSMSEFLIHLNLKKSQSFLGGITKIYNAVSCQDLG